MAIQCTSLETGPIVKPDTPFALVLEMHAVVLGGPVLILLASAAIIALMRPWRFSSAIGVVYKLALVGSILAVAVLFAWGAFLIGIGTMLEHPRYRHHVVCEPCF